mmetsp:Transcript_3999/g.11570  ORF Transcript_3999/g.11570 Transcript_3999/m.11570 type:complete len:152 (+) Transcript_3999:111-566(+)
MLNEIHLDQLALFRVEYLGNSGWVSLLEYCNVSHLNFTRNPGCKMPELFPPHHLKQKASFYSQIHISQPASVFPDCPHFVEQQPNINIFSSRAMSIIFYVVRLDSSYSFQGAYSDEAASRVDLEASTQVDPHPDQDVSFTTAVLPLATVTC